MDKGSPPVVESCMSMNGASEVLLLIEIHKIARRVGARFKGGCIGQFPEAQGLGLGNAGHCLGATTIAASRVTVNKPIAQKSFLPRSSLFELKMDRRCACRAFLQTLFRRFEGTAGRPRRLRPTIPRGRQSGNHGAGWSRSSAGLAAESERQSRRRWTANSDHDQIRRNVS